MEKVSYEDFREAFAQANKEDRELFGVVVFSQSNWEKEYSEKSRSYATFSKQWGWDYSKMGHCRWGFCLDGSDGIRLDYYDWVIDYCYFLTKEEYDEVAKLYA